MADFKTLDDLPDDLAGKKVIVRVDLNVPMNGASVADDTRLRALLPTVLELSDKGAIVLLLSHFGRPKGENRPDMSTAQLVRPLAELTGRSVRFIEDCQGPEAARAVAEVLPELKGKLDGSAIRVPTPNVSLVDLTFTPGRDTTVEEINAALKAAADSGPLKGVLAYTDEPLVSIDLNGDPASSTVDSLETTVLEGKLVRVLSWYDNEWGFSNRMIDTASAMARLG